MSSNTALSAGRVGGVGWQVDLPGLASLVLNLGASGLKRFAEAGVDFHTILCMGEIAEKCAASSEYRRELSVCREAQRTESQWLYKLVEIGAATSFVADELLKKRAGENVVALLSAILPVMSESSCDSLLLKLFEACNTPLDKTPGFGQLRSIRKSLTPLARKTQFKDRVFQYHVLARQLLDNDASTVNPTAYESIPSEETAVQIILALSKLVQEDSGYRLAYHGLRGSGWVIAYARHILGLPVCVLRSTSKPVPISGDYQNAKVLAYLFEQESKCELLLDCSVQDFFVTKSLDPSCHAGWLIDVRTTNVLDSYIPAADPLRKGVAVVARSMANSYIQKLVKHVTTTNPSNQDLIQYYSIQDPNQYTIKQDLIHYPIYCLPNLRKRVMGILSLLGFDPVDESDLKDGVWSQYIKLEKSTPTGSQRRTVFTEDPTPPYLVAGPAWIRSGLGHTQVSCNVHSTESSEDASAVHQDRRLDEQGIRHISFLSGIVEAACLLSFTDWDQNLRLLSTSFLEDPACWSKGLVFKKPLIEILITGSSGGMRQLGMIELCETTIDVCIGEREVWTPVFSDEKMLAFQHHGIVFVQNAAFHQTLDLQCCFIHLQPGAIIAEGEEKMKLYTYSMHEQKMETMDESGNRIDKLLAPVDSFPGISFCTRSKFSGENVYLQQDALVKDQICAIPSPGIISRSLAGLYVTGNCDHGYYDSVPATELDSAVDKLREERLEEQKKEAARLAMRRSKYERPVSSRPERGSVAKKKCPTFVAKPGLFLAGAECRSSILELWLQAVDQNAPGQWLAYHDWGDRHYLTVLQRGCCIACACRMVLDHCEGSNGVGGVSRIIHGRLAGEDMSSIMYDTGMIDWYELL